MKLRFLGQTYSSANNQIETRASSNKARFLGQNYTINVSITSVRSHLGARKYRGVIYGG